MISLYSYYVTKLLNILTRFKSSILDFFRFMDISKNQPQQAKYHKLTVLENAVSMCRYTLCNDLYVIDLFNDLSVGASTMLSS